MKQRTRENIGLLLFSFMWIFYLFIFDANFVVWFLNIILLFALWKYQISKIKQEEL